VDVVFAGSTEGLLAALLDRRTVSPEEAARIRKLIDKSERKKS
jgi:predicted transcriptional regulator